MADKAMPGWSVVLKKENRSRRLYSTEDDHGLGQEECRDDLEVFADMVSQGMASGDNVGNDGVAVVHSNGRRRPWNEAR